MTRAPTVSQHPLAEIIARKLSGISSVPTEYHGKMVSEAARAAVKWHQEQILNHTQKITFRQDYEAIARVTGSQTEPMVVGKKWEGILVGREALITDRIEELVRVAAKQHYTFGVSVTYDRVHHNGELERMVEIEIGGNCSDFNMSIDAHELADDVAFNAVKGMIEEWGDSDKRAAAVLMDRLGCTEEYTY